MKWLWNLGNLLLFAAALTRQSDSAAVLGRYSTSYALGLAFSLALMVTVALLTLTPPGRRLGKRVANHLLALIPRRTVRLAVAAALILAVALLLWRLPLSVGSIGLLVLFNVVLTAVALDALSAPPREGRRFRPPHLPGKPIGLNQPAAAFAWQRMDFALWNLGNLLLFTAALTRQSDSTAVLGRYSTGYALGLAFSAALVVMVAFLTLTVRGRRLGRRLAALIPHGTAALAVVAGGVLIGCTLLWSVPRDSGYLALILLFTGVMAAATLARLPAVPNPNPPRRSLSLIWALLIAVLVASFFSAHTVPIEHQWGDEAAWTNMADTWYKTGQAYIRISGHPPLAIIPGTGWWVIPYAIWLNIFGISLAAGRLFIWLLYLASVACIGWTGARLYDRQTGLTAALLTAISPLMLSFRIIRPEIGLAAFGALILFAYLTSRKRPLLAFVAGWLAILSLELHAAGLAYIVALLALYGFDSIGELRHHRSPLTRQALAVIAGMGIGTLVYLVLHVLIQSEPAAFFEYLRSSRSFLENDLLLGWLESSLRLIWERSPLELILFAVSVAGLAIRRSPADRLVLRFLAATAVSYFLLVPEPNRYLIIFMPFIAWGIAALLSFGFRPVSVPQRPAVTLLVLAALSAPFFAQSVPRLALNPLSPAAPTLIAERVRALSAPDEVVVGDPFSYWSLLDYPGYYLIWAESEFIAGPDYTSAAELWATLQPNLVVGIDSPGYLEIMPTLRQYVLDHRYEIVDSFVWQDYPVVIYRRPAGSP